MPVLEENASAFPLSKASSPPNPRAHEQSIITTNRKCLLCKYLRIISHLLFRPFKSFFSIPRKLCKETNCLQATQSEARLEPRCRYVLGRRRSPAHCQITHRDHKASLQIRDDTTISILCPPRTAGRSQALAGCRDPQRAVTQGDSKLCCAVELSQIRLWYLSKDKRIVCIHVQRQHKFSHKHRVHPH